MQCAFCNGPDGKHGTNCPTKRNGRPMDTITATAYPHSKNGHSFAQGMDFQDWVVEHLNKRGVYIQLHASKRYQFERGESVQMAEIKLDNLCTGTGRLSIEVGERTAVDRPWVPSGIYCRESTVFYIQGNYERFYLFDQKVLRRYHTNICEGTYEESPRTAPTVRKFYMPLADADEHCIFKVDCKATANT